MPIIGVKLCGAKCRTKEGTQCEQPASKGSGRTRCKMHGGNHYKNKTHGKTTVRANEQRRQERAFLKEMKAVTRAIKEKGEGFSTL